MGKEDKADKEESGFGFKDRAKAEETLRLLEAHEPGYRRLTVRGLLGRAKRVLSLTKAEDKRKNISEAMAVFEEWLARLDAGKEKKTESEKESRKEMETSSPDEKKNGDKDSEPDAEMEAPKSPKSPSPKAKPSDTVPGLGFKDQAAAEATLAALAGRDPDYQRLAVKGLVGRAKRVLTCTRDETKISNIKEAMAVFDKFLDDFDTQHLSRQNNPYLTLGVVRTVAAAADTVGDHQKAFIEAYASVGGEYKRLRTVAGPAGDKTWDIVRNAALKELKEKYADAKLFNDKDEPTKEHVEMILWAYSPEAARVKKLIPETKDESKRESDRKRRSSARDDESPSKKKKD